MNLEQKIVCFSTSEIPSSLVPVDLVSCLLLLAVVHFIPCSIFSAFQHRCLSSLPRSATPRQCAVSKPRGHPVGMQDKTGTEDHRAHTRKELGYIL